MPSRNVSRYIGQCMESVLTQEFCNFEIIAIDAMSDDGTWEILTEYADKDERIRLIQSEQKSYGYQVNLGIREAKGEYVAIVETDDFIDAGMFSVLYEKAQQNHVDYVKGAGRNYVCISEKVFFESDIDKYEGWGIEGKVINPADYPELLYKDRFLWLGLYKTSFLRDNEVVLSETDGAAYQDIGFQIQILRKAKAAMYIDAPIYHYRLDNVGASGYSHKAFAFLEYEFGKILPETLSWNREQRKNVFIKLSKQYMHRYHVMAASGCFWEEAKNDMMKLRAWILEAINDGVLQYEDFDPDLGRRLKVLSVGVKENYGAYLIDYLRQIDTVREWISDLRYRLEGAGHIIIFGCGLNGKYLRCLIEHLLPECTDAFCDNNAIESTEMVLGLPVLLPDKAVKMFSSDIYMLAAGKNEKNMRQQLLDLGIGEKQIVIYPFGRNIELLNTNVNYFF